MDQPGPRGFGDALRRRIGADRAAGARESARIRAATRRKSVLATNAKPRAFAAIELWLGAPWKNGKTFFWIVSASVRLPSGPILSWSRPIRMRPPRPP